MSGLAPDRSHPAPHSNDDGSGPPPTSSGWGRVIGAVRSVWPRSVLGPRRTLDSSRDRFSSDGLDEPATEPWGCALAASRAGARVAMGRCPSMSGGIADLRTSRARLLAEVTEAMSCGRVPRDEALHVRTELELATCWAELWSMRTACFGLLARSFSEGEAMRRMHSIDGGFPARLQPARTGSGPRRSGRQAIRP